MSRTRRAGRRGAARPPALVIALGIAFLLLVAALVIGSLASPEFPAYVPTAATPEPVGDSLVGPATYTVDAGAPDRWRRFHFARSAVTDSGGWDIAFRRTHIAAARGVGVQDLGAVPFDSVEELPADGYVMVGAQADTSHPAIGKWYDYNYLTHLLGSRGHVYAIRTSDGRYAKLEILSYYCATVGAACVTFRYAYQGNGSRRIRSPRRRRRGPGSDSLRR